jgi:hypothetical protein
MPLENKISPSGRNDSAERGKATGLDSPLSFPAQRGVLMLERNNTLPMPLSFRAKREISTPSPQAQAIGFKISPSGRNDSPALGKVYQPFGDRLKTIIEELNENLAA